MMEPPEPGDTDTASDYSSQPNFHSFPPSKCPSPQLFSASELSSTPPSHAFSTTHDASLAGYHVTQASFTTQLDLAVRAVWATRHGCKYLDVQVLLLSWESDDLGVKDKVSALESVFRDIYRFDVEWWRIPDLAPGRHATKKVIDFVEGGNSPDTLLILYYAGHAAPNPHQGGGLPCWVANRTRDSPQFDLSCVQPHLCQVDDTHPDVLLLYDSCHPANGHGSVKSGRAVIELLAATGFESIAPEVGPDSFTHCLIQELSIASRHPNGISIPELHRRQICRTQRGSQETVMMERARDGSLKVRTAGGAPMFEVPRRRTPMHCQLSRNDRPRAIVLAPLPATQAPHSTGSGFVDPDSCTGDALADHGDSKPQIHVLIRVSLAEDDLNEAQWKDWQCNAPPAVKGIKILGVLPSCSTLLLLQVPIEVWDLLPPSPAVSFVAFLSDNHSNTIPLLNESTVLGHPSQQTSVETPKNFASGKMGEKTDTEAPVNPPVELSTTDVAAPGGSALGLSNLGHYYDNGGPQHTSRVAFTASGNDKSLVNILNAVDVILPNIFRRLRTSNSIPNAKREHAVVEEVLEILTTSRSSAVIETCGNFDAKILSSPENLALLRRYIGSRDLLELDNPILNFSSRLGCLSIWLDDDARDPAAASVISATSFKSRPSSFWSKAKTVDTTSTFDFEEETLPNVGMPSHQAPSNKRAPEVSFPLPPNDFNDGMTASPEGPVNRPLGEGISTESRSATKIDKADHEACDHDIRYPWEYDVPYPGSSQFEPLIANAPSVNPQAYPTSDFSLGGEGSTTDKSINRIGDRPSEESSDRFYSQYVFEHSSRFAPGEVFKVLWSEPRPQGSYQLTSLVEEHMGQPFSVGIRRFIVVANDEGHCTCVPILTYERRACTKRGVKPNKHGIVYMLGSKPTMLRNEPSLGFRPVRMEPDLPTEKLAAESRVNYSKLFSVEHNAKVNFIGRIVAEDMRIVSDAVDKCWASRNREMKDRTADSRRDRRDRGR